MQVAQTDQQIAANTIRGMGATATRGNHNIDPGNIEVLRNGVFGRHQS